jgi:hypothetical protein
VKATTKGEPLMASKKMPMSKTKAPGKMYTPQGSGQVNMPSLKPIVQRGVPGPGALKQIKRF